MCACEIVEVVLRYFICTSGDVVFFYESFNLLLVVEQITSVNDFHCSSIQVSADTNVDCKAHYCMQADPSC